MDITDKITQYTSYMDSKFRPTNKKNAFYEIIVTLNDDYSIKEHSINIVNYKSKNNKVYKEAINGKEKK
jgi:hypothetical protein